MMKLAGFLGILLLSIYVSAEDVCYKTADDMCSTHPTKKLSFDKSCSAKYGAISSLETDLQKYVEQNIESSFDLLLLSTFFGNYEVNRPGFKGLYRKLSDKSWHDAIDLIKYITKRGLKMNWSVRTPSENRQTLELNEFTSLAKALDIEKNMANQALLLHETAYHRTNENHPTTDGSVAHYIEEKFFEYQADTVRTLSGYANELKSMLDKNNALATFLFDDYLKKTL